MGSIHESVMLKEGLLRFNIATALLTWMTLRYLASGGAISNAIKGFGFPHWTCTD
jgi:hypothetical protein